MNIRIRPLDTFFFRDGKPFSSGQETWADGVFPPSPSTLYGALRAIYFSHHPEQFKKANTVEDPSLNLKIKGIFLEIGEQRYLPLPNDCVVTKEGNEYLLEVIPNNHISSKKIPKFITTITPNEIIKDSGNNVLVKEIYYRRYLNGEKIRKEHFKCHEDYYCHSGFDWPGNVENS
ncbi:MAG: type III-B CRISPR module-associated Cmr3 family protein, partial [Pseudomonadota bacterium]|nr:type III-B CRISPR module-associated Cmr3 family protein [Pseudomonadota bacterium]